MAEKLNKKILIVEDEAPLRNAVTDILTFEGFTVFQAKNGQEGLDLALKEHPDLILLDLMMPIMDGPALIQALIKIQPGMPIIGASGLSQQMQAKVAGLGVKHFLCKPYTASALLDSLSEVLAHGG